MCPNPKAQGGLRPPTARSNARGGTLTRLPCAGPLSVPGCFPGVGDGGELSEAPADHPVWHPLCVLGTATLWRPPAGHGQEEKQ